MSAPHTTFQLLPALPTDVDVRELSFQNVINNILLPAGVKMGGFADELFLDLMKDEHDDMMCNICYLVANDCRCCDNRHVFCHSCIIAWSLTFGENAYKCPFCRCDQFEYNTDEELNRRIGSKLIRCIDEGCTFTSTLANYLLHCHGQASYSNANVNLDRLQQRIHRHREASSSPSPPHSSSESDVQSALQAQLIQSRMMIRQMMTLMRIEVQLRQQAMAGLQRVQNGSVTRYERLAQMEEALELNEQLSEIRTMLSSMFNHNIGVVSSRSIRRRPAHRDITLRTRPRRLDTNIASSVGMLHWINGYAQRHPLPVIAATMMPVANTSSNLETSDDDDDDDQNDTAVAAAANIAPHSITGEGEAFESDDDNYDDDSLQDMAVVLCAAASAAADMPLNDDSTDDDDEQLWRELIRGDEQDCGIDLGHVTSPLSLQPSRYAEEPRERDAEGCCETTETDRCQHRRQASEWESSPHDSLAGAGLRCPSSSTGTEIAVQLPLVMSGVNMSSTAAVVMTAAEHRGTSNRQRAVASNGVAAINSSPRYTDGPPPTWSAVCELAATAGTRGSPSIERTVRGHSEISQSVRTTTAVSASRTVAASNSRRLSSSGTLSTTLPHSRLELLVRRPLVGSNITSSRQPLSAVTATSGSADIVAQTSTRQRTYPMAGSSAGLLAEVVSLQHVRRPPAYLTDAVRHRMPIFSNASAAAGSATVATRELRSGIHPRSPPRFLQMPPGESVITASLSPIRSAQQVLVAVSGSNGGVISSGSLTRHETLPPHTGGGNLHVATNRSDGTDLLATDAVLNCRGRFQELK